MKRPSLGIALVAALLASGCKAKPTTLQVEPLSLKFTATGETVMLLASVLDEDGKRRLYTNPLRILDSKNPAMQALNDAAIWYLQLDAFDTNQILESKLVESGQSLTDFLEEMAAPTPTPGGGSASALSGAVGASR